MAEEPSTPPAAPETADTSAQGDTAPDTSVPAGFATATVPMGDENAPDDWRPPQTNAEGFAIDGDGLPLNHRLRAAALVDGGYETDPSGALDAARISAERDRLAAYDAEYPPIAASAKTSQLESLAADAEVDISSASTNEERRSLILAARPARV